MKPDLKVVVIAALLIGVAVGGRFSGLRRAGPEDSPGAIVASRGLADRWKAPGVARSAPNHPPTRPMISSVSPEIQSVFPGMAEAVADWRNFAPEGFTIQLAPGLLLPFRVTEVQRDQGRTVLTARLDKAGADPSGLDGAFLVSTANTPDRWEAVVVLPGEEYRIQVDQRDALIEEVRADGWSCGSSSRAGAATVVEGRAMPAPLLGQNTGESLVPAAAPGGSPATVDVLFLYNPEALAAKNGDRAGIDAACSNFIAASNAILVNSQVTNLRWRYLAAVAAPAYSTTATLQDDLDQMTTGSIAAFSAGKQSAYGADQVVMLVGGWRKDAAGVAWIGGGPNYVVVTYPCLSVDRLPASTATSVIVVCHEMGHNFGCRHDRATEGARDGDGRYAYGFLFADTTDTYPAADQGTVMSYAGSRIPYFSNPNIIYHGFVLGVPIGDPKAAFNAATMAENADRIAATNAEKSAPVITGQPQSVAVSVGQRMSLTVSAIGSGLAYQWSKDGVALGGATSLEYIVGSAALSDGGTYTVTISNDFGTATSQTASVTVSATVAGATGAASATMTAGGGSAGGGVFGPSFALGLVLLLARRRFRVRDEPRLRRA